MEPVYQINKNYDPVLHNKKEFSLGLPIVNKIINEHSGEFTINNNTNSNGVKVEVVFYK